MSNTELSDKADDYHHADTVLARTDHGRKPWVRCLMQVLWPAFLGAALTVGLLFSVIDPLQIEWVHVYLDDSREAAYTLGFVLFWILYAITCGITWYLATTETPHMQDLDGPGH